MGPARRSPFTGPHTQGPITSGHTVTTATPKTTTGTVPPAPYGVKLGADAHARLIIRMIHGRRPTATPAEREISQAARNALMEAYLPWIKAQATATSPSAQASEDRAAEAYLLCLEAMYSYDPSHGVPLGAYLKAMRATSGEKVTLAGMPLDTFTQKQRRAAAQAGQTITRPASLSAPAGSEDGLSIEDRAPSQAEGPQDLAERSELRAAIAEALKELTERQRDLVISRFGLDGRAPIGLKEIALSRGTAVPAVSKAVDRVLRKIGETSPLLRAHLTGADVDAKPHQPDAVQGRDLSRSATPAGSGLAALHTAVEPLPANFGPTYLCDLRRA